MDPEQLPSRKKRRVDGYREKLSKYVSGPQQICFLKNGAGGSGKSHIMKAVVSYAKKLCEKLEIDLTREQL